MRPVTDVRAHVCKHAIRRYAERALGHGIPAGLTDDEALARLHAKGVDLASIRERLADVGATAMRRGLGHTGTHGVIADGVRLRVVDGSVVTVLPHSKGSRNRAARNGET